MFQSKFTQWGSLQMKSHEWLEQSTLRKVKIPNIGSSLGYCLCLGLRVFASMSCRMALLRVRRPACRYWDLEEERRDNFWFRCILSCCIWPILLNTVNSGWMKLHKQLAHPSLSTCEYSSIPTIKFNNLLKSLTQKKTQRESASSSFISPLHLVYTHLTW